MVTSPGEGWCICGCPEADEVDIDFEVTDDLVEATEDLETLWFSETEGGGLDDEEDFRLDGLTKGMKYGQIYDVYIIRTWVQKNFLSFKYTDYEI